MRRYIGAEGCQHGLAVFGTITPDLQLHVGCESFICTDIFHYLCKSRRCDPRQAK
jgi:hypothetical protein